MHMFSLSRPEATVTREPTFENDARCIILFWEANDNVLTFQKKENINFKFCIHLGTILQLNYICTVACKRGKTMLSLLKHNFRHFCEMLFRGQYRRLES